MSYTQIECGGKVRGWKFNKFAQYELSKRTDVDNLEVTASYALFYAGLKANCFVKQEESDFTFENACDWFDELTDDQVLKIKEAFEASQFYLQNVPKQEEDKKKVRKKKVTSSTGTGA